MKKKLLPFISALLAMVLILSCVGCGETTEQTTAAPADTTAAPAETTKAPDDTEATTEAPSGEKIKIGVSQYNLTAQYNTNLKEAMEKYMETENLGDKIELIQMDAQSDPTKQNEQVDTLIAQGCKAIILNAGDRNAQVTAVQNASAAGIPVIELCSATAAEDLRETYVGSEDIVSGRMLATALCEAAGGSGKMVLLHGLVGVTAEQRRHEGLQEILDADFPDVEIVAEKICNWSRAEAMTAMENIVQSGLEFNIVYAENDEMAMGALNAIKGSATENVIIGGIDAIPDAVQAVLDGDLYCTVFQDAVSQAEKALEVAILAAEGQDLEPLYDIPYVLVTKDNAADFLG